MVSVISLWKNILYINREPTLWLRKGSGGVPQGSILGPLLFLVHVKDMPQAVKSNLPLYADDLCLMYKHRDVEKNWKTAKHGFWKCLWLVRWQ